jgi:hypothetical protein
MALFKFFTGRIGGKLGQLVGSSRRGTNYLKLYKKPKDPKSAKQIAIRSVFKKTSFVASSLFKGVLKPYTFPIPEKCSAYSHMIHLNRLMFTNKAWDPAKLKIFEGPLENSGIASAVLAGGSIKVFFDAVDGKGSDVAIAIAYYEALPAVFYAIGKRSDGTVELSLSKAAARDVNSLHVYLTFSRPPKINTEEKGLVSVTAYWKM